MEPQDPMPPDQASQEPETPEAALRDARERFVAAFPKRSDSIGLLLGMVAALGPRGPLAALRQIVHRTGGLAGTLGFPTVSVRAQELEDELEDVEQEGVDTRATDRAYDALQEAFAHDLSDPPDWAGSSQRLEGKGRMVLLVEDDEDQREVVSIYLEAAGFRTVQVSAGDRVVEVATARQPDIILLDANLPGLDGYAVCRLLKTSPQLAGIPVIFLTVRSGLDDRLVGLMLGADDYLVKPVDMTELLLRIQLLSAKRDRVEAAQQGRMLKDSPELDYEAFSLAAHEQLAAMPAILVLARVPEDLMQPAFAALRAESRRRDLVARYDALHIILLMAEMPPLKVLGRVTEMLARLKPEMRSRIKVGLAASPGAGSKTFETLLVEADEGISLAVARGELVAVGGQLEAGPTSPAPAGSKPPSPSAVSKVSSPAAVTPPAPAPAAPQPPAAPLAASRREFTILLADGDPEVARLAEEQLRKAGFRTLVAADGVEALSSAELHKPDAMVLGLTIPGMTGLEVLAKLAQVTLRPRIIVLAARGGEQDVTRAFALGADDYLTTPFSPEDLLARVRRLLR